MRYVTLTLAAIILAFHSASSAWAEEQDESSSKPSPENNEKAAELDLDPAAVSPRLPQPRLNEDSSIKIRVEPVIMSSLVDRVVEPAKIFVAAPGAAKVEVFLVPVDSPYGGKPLNAGKLLGSDSTPGDGFCIVWDKPESCQYAKIFAVVHPRNPQGKSVHSRSLDIGIAGRRYRPEPIKAPAKEESAEETE